MPLQVRRESHLSLGPRLPRLAHFLPRRCACRRARPPQSEPEPTKRPGPRAPELPPACRPPRRPATAAAAERRCWRTRTPHGGAQRPPRPRPPGAVGPYSAALSSAISTISPINLIFFRARRSLSSLNPASASRASSVPSQHLPPPRARASLSRTSRTSTSQARPSARHISCPRHRSTAIPLDPQMRGLPRRMATVSALFWFSCYFRDVERRVSHCYSRRIVFLL